MPVTDGGEGGNGGGTDETVAGEAVDGADETASTEEAYVRHSIKGLVNGPKRNSGGGWLKFILILLVIGIGARLAVMKSNGVDNSDLLIEFFPIKAIKKKFRPEPQASAVETASDTKVVNGYLQKSNTAAVRPVYSNAASASASRVRTTTTAKAPVKRPSSIQTMTAADKAATPRKTTTASKPSSGNTAFNQAQAMKELRAMSEKDGLGAGAPPKK